MIVKDRLHKKSNYNCAIGLIEAIKNYRSQKQKLGFDWSSFAHLDTIREYIENKKAKLGGLRKKEVVEEENRS